MVVHFEFTPYCHLLSHDIEFGSLTQVQLMEKVKALQNMAYRLGVEEGKYYFVIDSWQINCFNFSKRNE